ncbi:MAG: radical SAM protein [Desulfomonile sp.]|nr:radical SAM protein [Desulfomonile sp.]
MDVVLRPEFGTMIRGAVRFGVPFSRYLLGMKFPPVLAGYKITHRCNLRCMHCPYWKRNGEELDFGGVIATLDGLRRLGVRILILEGGEPLLWRDRHYGITDVITAARQRFPSVCITTNGTLPWDGLPADRIWVSLDGPRAVHDEIRGEGVFDRVLSNIARCGQGHAFVSTTINRRNAGSIPEMLSILRGKVQGVTIQFYYPYGGLPDNLFLSPEDRSPLMDELIRLKTLGYPVANSISSLLEMKKSVWTCEDGLLANAEPDGTISRGCYLKNRGASVCSLCGFTAHNEMTLAFRGRWESIRTGLDIFFGRTATAL